MMVTLDSATEQDVPNILQMMESFYAHEGIEFIEEKSRATLIDFMLKENIGKLWLIKNGEECVGYCCLIISYTLEYHGHDCFLDELFILPEFQNKGIGAEVLKLLSSYAAERGINAMHLFVFDENQKAFEFYQRNGFSKRKGSLMVKFLK
jgi:diamine N-acetyltransferase